MTIENLHILVELDKPVSQATQVQVVLEELIADHRQGKHTYGRMFRACPLCHPQ